MKNIRIFLLITAMTLTMAAASSAPAAKAAKAPAAKAPVTVVNKPTYTEVNSLALVAAPQKYLNKYVKVKATFDKFSTLGLDYKPAYRSSEKYITFLIKRDDVKDHTIPLSEMKIFLKRDIAEKHIDLNSGDEVEFSGKVFSTALGDVWFDVDNFVVLKRTETEKK